MSVLGRLSYSTSHYHNWAAFYFRERPGSQQRWAGGCYACLHSITADYTFLKDVFTHSFAFLKQNLCFQLMSWHHVLAITKPSLHFYKIWQPGLETFLIKWRIMLITQPEAPCDWATVCSSALAGKGARLHNRPAAVSCSSNEPRAVNCLAWGKRCFIRKSS